MTLEAGILFAFAAMLCWGVGDFLIQRSVWKVGYVEARVHRRDRLHRPPSLRRQRTPPHFRWREPVAIALPRSPDVWRGLLVFEALKKGKLSVIEVVLELELPVTAVVGIYFLRESLSLAQLAAMAMVFVGITLIAARTLSLKSGLKGLEKGVIIGLLGAIGMGAVNFLTGLGSKAISPLLIIWVPWVVFTALCLGYILYTGTAQKFAENFRRNRKPLVLIGVFDTLAWFSYAFAAQNNSIAVTTAITESYPVVAISLGL